MDWVGGQFHQECLTQSIWWIDTAKCWCVVGQRKLLSVVKISPVSKVSPGLGWYQHSKSGICHTAVNDSIVVRTCRLLTAKSRSTRGASHHSAFIVSQTRWSCQPSGWIRLQSSTVVRTISKL